MSLKDGSSPKNQDRCSWSRPDGQIFLHRTPRAELVAAFSPDPSELACAKGHLEPYGVALYDSYEKMIEHPELMAVVIGTAASAHADELHTLCEKPLSTEIEVASSRSVLLYRNGQKLIMPGISVPERGQREKEVT